VQVVQPAQEQEVGDLFYDFQRVGDAAGPEGVPDLVDLALDGAGDHVEMSLRTSSVAAVGQASSSHVPGRMVPSGSAFHIRAPMNADKIRSGISGRRATGYGAAGFGSLA
jgi:hypothetical protein